MAGRLDSHKFDFGGESSIGRDHAPTVQTKLTAWGSADSLTAISDLMPQTILLILVDLPCSPRRDSL